MTQELILRAVWRRGAMPLDEGARRLVSMLADLGAVDPRLGVWRPVTSGAEGVLTLEADALLGHLQFDARFPEFGAAFTARVAPRGAQLSVVFGATKRRHPEAGGEVLLHLPGPRRLSQARDLLGVIVDHWSADFGTVHPVPAATTGAGDLAGLEPGWLTYVRSDENDLRRRRPQGATSSAWHGGRLFRLAHHRPADAERLASSMRKTFHRVRDWEALAPAG